MDVAVLLGSHNYLKPFRSKNPDCSLPFKGLDFVKPVTYLPTHTPTVHALIYDARSILLSLVVFTTFLLCYSVNLMPDTCWKLTEDMWND